MTTFNIYQLIDFSTGAIIPYEPRLAPQVAEIISATTRAAEAARLQQCRNRLTNIKPARAIAGDGGESLARELFPPPEMAHFE